MKKLRRKQSNPGQMCHGCYYGDYVGVCPPAEGKCWDDEVCITGHIVVLKRRVALWRWFTKLFKGGVR